MASIWQYVTDVCGFHSLLCWGGTTWAHSRHPVEWKRWCGRSRNGTDGRTDETSRPPAPQLCSSLLTRHTNARWFKPRKDWELFHAARREIKVKVIMTDKQFPPSPALANTAETARCHIHLPSSGPLLNNYFPAKHERTRRLPSIPSTSIPRLPHRSAISCLPNTVTPAPANWWIFQDYS